MQWGREEEYLNDLIEDGFVPPALLSRPDLDPALEWVWKAFWGLSSDRQVGMSLGPIPWSSINAYGLRMDLDLDEFEKFEGLIRAMDGAYLDHHNKKKS